MDAVLQIIRNIGPLRLAAIIGSVLVILVVLILITVQRSSPDLVPLYSDLGLKDSNEIVQDLETKNIPYELRAGGTEILVPADRVLRLRMSLAASGLPSSGNIVGYEIFDKSDSFGTSNFIQNVNLLRALEGELARTISSIANIESARVHLVLPKRELFSREKQQPSASVVLGVAGANSITKAEINAISHLVATAVTGLTVDRITIVDTSGRPLKLANSSDDSAAVFASHSEELKVEYEKRLKNVVQGLLEQSVGLGKIRAEVAAEINFDRVITNSEIFDPDGQVIRSVQEIDDKESASNKSNNNNVSVTTNLPNTTQQSTQPQAENLSTKAHTDTTTNYEISKTVRNQISETGSIKRLSIAVLIDGTYTTDPKTKKVSYIPRTQDELNQYENLVKSAVGFDAKRGDTIQVTNMRFVSETALTENVSGISWLEPDLPSIIKTLLIGTFILLILLLFVRPIVIRAFDMKKTPTAEETSTVSAMNQAQTPASTEAKSEAGATADAKNTVQTEGNKSSTQLKSVNDLLNNNPNEAVTTIRKWIKAEQ